MPKVSVIIPVYNVEPYLERCLDSVLNQSLTDWEAICVDDSSPDRCPEILERYAAKDKRFVVVHKENGGVSIARNTALDMAKGDFLFFMDSDDFLHPQTFEICVYQAERDNSDMVAYTYNRAYRTWTIVRHFLGIKDSKRVCFKKYRPEKVKYLCTDNIFDQVTECSHKLFPGMQKRWRVKHCQSWRVCVRRSAAGHVRFELGIIYEDVPWWGEVLINTKRATINNLPLYYYYPNKTSYLNSTKQQSKIKDLRVALASAERIFNEQATEAQKAAWNEKFMEPFREHIARKVERYGEAD